MKVSAEASEVQSVLDLSAQCSHPLDTHNTITKNVQIGVFVGAENSNKNGSALHVSNCNTIMVENRSVLCFGLKMTNYSMSGRHSCHVLCPDFITTVIIYNMQQKPWTCGWVSGILSSTSTAIIHVCHSSNFIKTIQYIPRFASPCLHTKAHYQK